MTENENTGQSPNPNPEQAEQAQMSQEETFEQTSDSDKLQQSVEESPAESEEFVDQSAFSAQQQDSQEQQDHTVPDQDPEQPSADIDYDESFEQADQDQSQEDEESAAPDEEDSEERSDEETEQIEVTTETVVEAVLFASDEPLNAKRLSNIVETGVSQVRKDVANLNEKYKENNHSFRIEEIAGGYQMMTLADYNSWLKKLFRNRSDTRLSPAALETLAIVAYKQPIIRADIEAIRGVAVGEMLRSLMYKGLVKIVGRAEVIGRPMLYGTTRRFLEVFGLNTLKDLPESEDLKKPDQQ